MHRNGIEETSTNIVEVAMELSGGTWTFYGCKYDDHYFVVVEENEKNLFMLNLFMIRTYKQ